MSKSSVHIRAERGDHRVGVVGEAKVNRPNRRRSTIVACLSYPLPQVVRANPVVRGFPCGKRVRWSSLWGDA